MIAHISGEIIQCSEGSVVIDVGGIGYHVNIPQSTRQELSKKEKITLHTHLNVREDALTLFGFINTSELEMFKLLINVTGIGPQIAMKILSDIKMEDFAAAIINEDDKILTNISGIGKKNAKRLILELKDTLKKNIKEPIPASISSINYDAISALISLGFQQKESREAVEAVAAEMNEPTAEAIIKGALLQLKNR